MAVGVVRVVLTASGAGLVAMIVVGGVLLISLPLSWPRVPGTRRRLAYASAC